MTARLTEDVTAPATAIAALIPATLLLPRVADGAVLVLAQIALVVGLLVSVALLARAQRAHR